mgnify:CR=1 FL=1
MIEYYIIFSILSFLAYKEIHKPEKLNAYSYIFLILLFSIFIGLRNEIGCDWTAYKNIFNLTKCTTSDGTINLCNKFGIYNTLEYLKFKEIGFSSINLIISKFGGNLYFSNYFFSLLFVIPLLNFCSNLKRPFLAILVSYPYLITVIGIGTIRQAIAIAFLMVGINALNKNKIYKYYFFNSFSIIFHYSSLIFIFLPLLISPKRNIKLKKNKKFLFYLFLILGLSLIIFNNNYFSYQLNGYLNYIEATSFKSPLMVWSMISLPAIFILKNYKDIKEEDENRFWKNYSIICILMIFLIFFNNIISLRLLLYFLPLKIYALSNLPQISIFKYFPTKAYLITFVISLSTLTVWLNFANHSYCYLPYKNLLLN